MFVKVLGSLVDRIKKQRLIMGLVRWFRSRFPVLWGIIMRKVKPVYLAYRVSISDKQASEFLQAASDFNNREWQRNQSLKYLRGSQAVTFGISNKSPSVDPNALLERINKNLNT